MTADEKQRYMAALHEHLGVLFDGLASEIAPRLAAETDREKCRQILHNAIMARLRVLPEFAELERSEARKGIRE